VLLFAFEKQLSEQQTLNKQAKDKANRCEKHEKSVTFSL